MSVSGWPRKTRDIQNHHIDSTIWNSLKYRPDDVVIASYAKSGTTWLQQIVSQLIFQGREGLDVVSLSPWIEMRAVREQSLASAEAQSHRRFLKTHLPVDAIVFSPQAKYLYVARDGRDVVWSMYNHHLNASPLLYQVVNETPGRIGSPLMPPNCSVVEYFQAWLDRDGYPWLPFWQHVHSWWNIRSLPNVLMIHFSDLKTDLPRQIRRIATFLEIPIDPVRLDAIVEHCSFPYMKAHAEQFAIAGGAFWNGGAQTFVHKGTNGRWREALNAQQSARYEITAIEHLGAVCAQWLERGGYVPE